MTLEKDLAVIGGGVIGLSCLLHLKERHPDMEAVLVDAPTRPGVASRAAAGMLPVFAEFAEEGSLFNFARESYDYYPEFLDAFGSQGLVRPELEEIGLLMPAGGARAERAERHARFAERFTEVEELSQEQVSNREPVLEGEAWEKAYRLPGAVIDPRLLHESLKTAAKSMGVLFLAGNVTEIKIQENRATELYLSGRRTIRCGKLLVSTGSWSREISGMLGMHLEVEPIKGQVARLGSTKNLLHHIVHAQEIYLAPRKGRGIVIGATMEDAGFNPSVEKEAILGLRDKALELAPGLQGAPIADSWAGFRPKTADGLPLIGWSGMLENVLLATGHHRNGILLTPATGRMLADCHDAGDNTPAGAFNPERCVKPMG